MKALSIPRLHPSLLAFRLGMARRRTSAFPMDRLDFILMDLERPDLASRHAHWCTGDCSGRTLEFLSYAQGIDGQEDPRLEELFMRMLRQKRESGLFGRWASLAQPTVPEAYALAGTDKVFPAFIRYYQYSGDARALEAAQGIAAYILTNRQTLLDVLRARSVASIEHWTIESFALLYDITRDSRYLEMAAELQTCIGSMEQAHSHGYLTTMRGLQQMAIVTGDMAWNERPEQARRRIVEEKMEMADGCISECFPRSGRNEGCSIADWVMLNLNAGYLGDDDGAYEKAEHILYNALFFNQILTGGLIHRELLPGGYGSRGIQEAWWCCTQTGGLAMAMAARHCVTRSGHTVRINFLVPGDYTLPGPQGDIQVRISTSWPKGPEAEIRIDPLPPEMDVHIRRPAGVHGWQCAGQRTHTGFIYRTSGAIGHYLKPAGDDRYLLQYGPMILVPPVYSWGQGGPAQMDSTVPEGYIPPNFPSMDCRIVKPGKDENGFLAFSHTPFPEWSFYEEGPDASVDLGGASVNVPLAFAAGTVKEARFWPMCQTFSTLCISDTPLLFGVD